MTSILQLTRLKSTYEYTHGILFHGQNFLCYTLELPWRNNEKLVSCIPWGRYVAIRHPSPRFGMTLAVKEVPGRSGIIFHAGNTVVDSKGCVLVGTVTDWGGTLSVSRRAIEMFRLWMTDNDIREIEFHVKENL